MCDDDQVMIRIQGGDAAAFETLVDRHQAALIGFFVRNLQDRHLAEDLAQETLLRVYNEAWNYLPCGRFRSWMYRIARNLMIDHHRRGSHDALIRAASRSQAVDVDAMSRLVGEFTTPDEAAGELEVSALVDQSLAEIPEEQRLTLTLHYYAGLPLSEIAEITETSLATCKSRLRLAREKLVPRLRRRGVESPLRE